MQSYELALIIEPSLDEAGITTLTDKINNVITRDGGEITRIDSWGKRQLAYPIKDRKDGQYLFVYTQLNPDAISELDRSLKLSEEVLRFRLFREGE